MLSKEKQENIDEKFVEMLGDIKTMDEYIHFLFLIANILGAFVNGFEDDKENLMILIKNTLGGAKQL